MKCLKCKKKMQTKRTRAEPGKVYRERYCKKDRYTVRTLELPESTIAGEKREYQERIEKMTELYEETLRELDIIKETVRNFFLLLKKVKK